MDIRPMVLPGKQNSGFTILEMVVVIAIFSLLAVAAAASMKMAERPAPRQACEYVMEELIRARNEAVKEEENCQFTFDFAPDTRGYTYTMLTSGKTKTVFLGERWRGEVYFLRVSPGAPDQPPNAACTFNPRGLLNNTCLIYITDRSGLLSQTGKVYRVQVSLTGEVEAQVRDFGNPTWFEF